MDKIARVSVFSRSASSASFTRQYFYRCRHSSRLRLINETRPTFQIFQEVHIVLWLTGLSSAGKSTISERLVRELRAIGYRAEPMDGDVIRQELCRDLGFSKEDRDENVRRIAFVAKLLAKHSIIVVVSVISPYRQTREEVRSRIPGFVEVYVNAPIEICERRDVKGLYRRARAGELQGFTGVDDPYEPPLSPEIECRTALETPEESVRRILDFVTLRLPPPGVAHPIAEATLLTDR